MDVLIKNIEMPKERIMLEIFPNGRVLEINPHNNARIPTEAEAIELLPHGDLIDRKELTERLQDFVKWCKDGRKQGAEFVLDCPLPNAPVVVEANNGTDN